MRSENANDRFYFYSHEPDEPPHIHVDKDGASAKFWLEQVMLARSTGFRPHTVNELYRLVRERQAELLETWHGFFGRNS